MARSRNIKPGFFKNEQLVELPFETRLLFAGLWTLVDREGRTEDRPKKIKMELFPADSVDVDSMLTALHESGEIVRYEVDGSRYIEVINFVKHQKPHPKEPASVIPSPESQPECGAEERNGESRKNTASREKVLSSQALPSSNLNAESLCAEAVSNDTPTPTKRSRKAPDGWEPNPIQQRQAMSHVQSGVDVKAELARFRAHTFEKPKADWDGEWVKWLIGARPRRPDPQEIRGRVVSYEESKHPALVAERQRQGLTKFGEQT